MRRSKPQAQKLRPTDLAQAAAYLGLLVWFLKQITIILNSGSHP